MGIFRQFPYSNFHDMNMDQIIKIMREMQDEWETTKNEWSDMKEFINNYFDNLDVSEEVLAAIRIMASDGSLNKIIDPVISQTTADWLAHNITVTTGETVIDSSLTIAGAAADAKATGDYLNTLNDAIINVAGEEVSWEIGRPGWAQRWINGGVTQNADCDCTKYIDVTRYKYLKYMAFCSTAATTNIGIAFFTAKDETTYISGVAGYAKSSEITMKPQWAVVPDNAIYARFTVTAGSDNFYIIGFPNISDEIDNLNSLDDPEYPLTFISGAISAAGSGNTNNATRIRTVERESPQIQRGDFILFNDGYEGRVAVYRLPEYNTTNFVKWLDSGFTKGAEFIPDDCEGYYAGLLIRKIGNETDDISDDVPTLDQHVKYCRKSYNVFKGKKLSVLGDSISALQGYVPTGYDIYYNGSNHGITSFNQMWYQVLAAKLGLDICVINAYSGSAVTQLEDAAHVDKIPMSSDERTAGLSDGTNVPDIIVIAGGVNDYTYAQSAQSEPLEWDGKSMPVLGNSFTEAYACMIKKIQTNYPDAIIVCLSTFFTMRGTDNGYTLTHAVGDNVYTQEDYNKAIKAVCEQMRVPYLDVTDIGFNRNNYYPTYAEDKSEEPTHPNAAGHRVIGVAVAEKIRDLITGYQF